MSETLFDQGLKIRRDVLGAEYVDKSFAAADDFSRPMQEYTTECCWGKIWARPGLDHRTRSIVNLSMIAGLNRHHEFKLHVKTAIKNGVTKAEISEILLQVACYCGVPAGVESFRLASEAFKEAGI
jgi:4-carboxymuconolactone decarboxylase